MAVDGALRAPPPAVEDIDPPRFSDGVARRRQPRYNQALTRLLEEAVATVSALPDDVQDEAARMLLQFVGIEQAAYRLTAEEEADLDASIAEAERGELATDDDVRAMWAKHGL